ncbi:MAG: hypothetical protein M3041_15315 [Acidobacteriota bacterium]|nr:hypothetical protein [Acidobacteriota bacterium]
MARTRLLALALSIFGSALQAQQVTFVRGNTLSQLINNLYGGNGIDLARTGHEAHFGETGDFQNFTNSLQAALQSRSFIPVPSSVGLVSYRFSEATGTYERVEGALGPILSERGSTSGKGTLNFSATYTFANYETINGSDSTQLVLKHCLLPECVGNSPLSAPYLHDTVNIDVHFRLKSQAIALAAVYGVTNQLDVGVVVPYVRNDLQVFTHGLVVVAPGSVPTTHYFDPNVETPDQFGTAAAVGIGDIVARAKYRLMPKASFESAVLSDLTLPTGDKDNFLGTGAMKLKATYILSKTVRRFTPHANAGYEIRFGETQLDLFDYRFGTEIAATPRFTVTTDIIGAIRPHASALFRGTALGNQQLIGHSEIDGSIGAKWKLTSERALLFNILVPMNKSGIRPTAVITAGLQMPL